MWWGGGKESYEHFVCCCVQKIMEHKFWFKALLKHVKTAVHIKLNKFRGQDK